MERMKGVMLSKEVLQSCNTVEDFLLSYNRESIKLGQCLTFCPEAQWFPDEAFEVSSCSRALSEEVKKVVQILNFNNQNGEDVDVSSSISHGLEKTETPERDRGEGLLELPFVVGWSLCAFSLGVLLGRRGW